ncbi:MAG TPA: class I SAM-dependent methyltransferase [Thermomicrobiales bacterium]|nr:class I SAM-dependent methyltransferase [Thermomicrobiales bacterium]
MTGQQADQLRQAWDAIADRYDAVVTPSNARLANTALERIDLRPGVHFLDVASGTGALSLAAARRGATVLATDISPCMIERLTDNARRQGLSRVEGRVMDGQELDIDDSTFDCSGSMFGVMLFPDLPRGLREMVRVTKPDGQVLMVTFGPPANVEFLQLFIRAAHQVVPEFTGLPMDPPPLPFQVSSPAKLRDEMVTAGLREVRVETVSERKELESGLQLWTWIASSNPIGAAMTASLSPEQGESVRAVLDETLRQRAGGNGTATITNAVNIATGTV